MGELGTCTPHEMLVGCHIGRSSLTVSHRVKLPLTLERDNSIPGYTPKERVHVCARTRIQLCTQHYSYMPNRKVVKQIVAEPQMKFYWQ